MEVPVPTNPPAERGQPTVLVADDDASVRTLVTLTLELEGLTVDSVVDGDAALAALAEADYDCAVIDVMMPRRDGIDVVRALRADPRHATLPIIMLSAKAQSQDMTAGLAAGADRYLTKPFDPFDLVATIHSLLAARGA